MEGSRRYKQPVSSLQKMRAMRAINVVRRGLLMAAVEEENMDLANNPEHRQLFVHRHRKWQEDLAGHFPYVEIRDDAYASDIADSLARDITYYILHGDTPGGP